MCLRQLRETLEQDQPARGDGGAATRRARDVNRRIIEDAGGDNPPIFSTASQNVMAAALLLRAMPEPSTPEGRRVRQGLRGLLEQAVVQNVESSVSQSHDTRARRLGDQPPNKAPTVQGPAPPNPQGGARAPSVHERVGPTWTPGPPSRPDDVTGTRPSLDGTDRAEAEGTTLTTTAARRQSLRVPASSARPSAGPSSRPASDSPLTSPSSRGDQP